MEKTKKAWWPMICAIFYMPFVGLFYIGKKNNDKKSIVFGVVYLVALAILYALRGQYEKELWFTLLLLIYWFCGMFHTHYAWKDYQNLINR